MNWPGGVINEASQDFLGFAGATLPASCFAITYQDRVTTIPGSPAALFRRRGTTSWFVKSWSVESSRLDRWLYSAPFQKKERTEHSHNVVREGSATRHFAAFTVLTRST
jgi:hypothetical protein